MSRPEVEFDLKVQQNLVIEPSRRRLGTPRTPGGRQY